MVSLISRLEREKNKKNLERVLGFCDNVKTNKAVCGVCYTRSKV